MSTRLSTEVVGKTTGRLFKHKLDDCMLGGCELRCYQALSLRWCDVARAGLLPCLYLKRLET